MYLAPAVEFTAYRQPAPSGQAGIMYSAGIIRRLIDQWRTDPQVIQAATSLIYNQPEKDEHSEAHRLFAWVRDCVRYVRDVAGMEQLATPGATMRRLAGDCDDQVSLLGALLESVGYPTRLVIASYTAPGAWEHIYLQAMLGGQWVSMDPTEHQPMGWEPPGAVSLWIEPR